jgi:isopenicillin-N epimerase
MQSLKSEYLLDPEVVFLNHGSFGACPRPVFETYQNWQRELEWNPVEFIGSRLPKEIEKARCKLAAYLGSASEDVVYFTNPTTAFNMVSRSLDLSPGDEVLTTSYEYPAMMSTWDYIIHKTGAKLVCQPTPLPFTTAEDFVEAFWAGVTPKTRVIFLSHIAAFIAVILPIQEICRRARQAGILTIIDGAHAPGQIRLNLPEIEVDFYIGACHKWLSAPKGSGFLYARQEKQSWLEPLVISHGWQSAKYTMESSAPGGLSWLVHFNQSQGTRDPSAFLTVPEAIKFQEEHSWDEQQTRCHALASQTRQRINDLTGLTSICPDSRDFFNQMATARLPLEIQTPLGEQLKFRRIVIPVLNVNDMLLVRFSFQAYNDQSDVDCLVEAIAEALTKMPAAVNSGKGN